MIGVIFEIVKQGLGLFSERQRASHDLKIKRMEAGISSMQSSWTDEFLILVWASPVIVGWFEPAMATAWFKVFDNAPEWYKVGWIAITGAVYAVPKLGDYAFSKQLRKDSQDGGT